MSKLSSNKGCSFPLKPLREGGLPSLTLWELPDYLVKALKTVKANDNVSVR